jgi:hypothetical protein
MIKLKKEKRVKQKKKSVKTTETGPEKQNQKTRETGTERSGNFLKPEKSGHNGILLDWPV